MIRCRLYRLISSFESSGSAVAVAVSIAIAVYSSPPSQEEQEVCSMWERSVPLDASGHRGDDADGVAGADGSLFFLQIANVFVIQIDVDEAAQLSLFVVK